MTVRYRYSKWDGSQEPFGPGADEVLSQLSESLFEHGDLMKALQELYRRGVETKSGQSQGLNDLMERLRRKRQERLQQFNLDSVMEDILQKLEHVKDLERAGAERSVAEAEQRLQQIRSEPAGPSAGQPGPEKAPGEQQAGDPGDQSGQPQGAPQSDPYAKLLDQVKRRADAARNKLDSLPPSAGGQIRELMEHDFIDQQARKEFNDLLDMLRKQMMSNVARQMADQAKNMTGGQKDALKEFLRDLNKMLRDRMEGKEPDFSAFMDRWGEMFGENQPGNLDEFLDMMQQQMAQMQSLMRGMSPEQQQELMQAMSEALDGETLSELAELGALMSAIRPPSDLAADYPFMGQESLTLDQAMDLMGEMQGLDQFEDAMEQAAATGDLEGLNGARLAELLGPEAERTLKELQELARKLEDAGYVKKVGDRWELTPRTIRRLGEKALGEVFGRLGKDRVGGHRATPSGGGGDLTGATRPYEMGEEFDLNLQRSLMNAVKRRGPGKPVRFEIKDFEIDQFEATVNAATALLVDQSSSMWHYGRWPAAKKVAMALNALIQGQFPRDRLFVVGFSDHAEKIRPGDLPAAVPNMWMQGTNMHHALMIARKDLAKEPTRNRQVIMVTDGEPTAHWEAGYGWFNYPPTSKTISETLREVKRCTAAGITINIFMLDRSPYLMRFVDYVTRINRGRAFFAEPDRLGDYVLIDYMTNRRKRVA